MIATGFVWMKNSWTLATMLGHRRGLKKWGVGNSGPLGDCQGSHRECGHGPGRPPAVGFPFGQEAGVLRLALRVPCLPKRTSRPPPNPSGKVTTAWPLCLWRRYAGVRMVLDIRSIPLCGRLPLISRVLVRTIRRRWVLLTKVRRMVYVKSGRLDSNQRPHGPEPCALAKLSYAPLPAESGPPPRFPLVPLWYRNGVGPNVNGNTHKVISSLPLISLSPGFAR